MKKIIILLALLFGTSVYAETVQLNEPSFSEKGIVISGNTPDGYDGENITLQVIKPGGTLGDYTSIHYIREFPVAADGSFSFSFFEPMSVSGINYDSYGIYVGGKNLEWTSLDVDNYDTVNVQDYGAEAAGATDASSAIQQAVNRAYSAGGTLVYFPQGEYLIQNNVSLKSGITLAGGAGTKLILDGAGFEICAAENVVIDGLEFTGTGTAITANDSNNITLRNIISEVALISADECQNIAISQCSIPAIVGNAIEALSSEITISDSFLSGYVAAENSELMLSGCVIKGGTISLNSCGDAAILNNQIAGTNVLLSGCTVSRLASNGFSENAQLSVLDCRDIRVESNILKSDAADHEILKISGERIFINGNTFWYGAGKDGLESGEGVCSISIDSTKNLTLQNNYFGNFTVNISNSQDIAVSGNMQLLENILPVNADMLFLENVTEGIINENSIITDKKTAAQAMDVQGIRISEKCRDITVRANKISGFKVSINPAGEDVSVHNNYIDVISGENRLAVSLYNNRTPSGNTIELSGIEKATNGSRYFYNNPTSYLGQVFTDGEWKSFEPVSNDEIKSLVIEQNDNLVTSVFRGYSLDEKDTMVTAVCDEAGKMITSVIKKTEDMEEIRTVISLDDLDKRYVVKSFLWSGTDTMTPIYHKKEIITKTQSELDAQASSDIETTE